VADDALMFPTFWLSLISWLVFSVESICIVNARADPPSSRQYSLGVGNV
jgi:hypothetical protein